MAKTRRTKSDQLAAIAAIKETDVKKVLDQLGDAQASVQGTLAALGATMSEKIDELRKLEVAIDTRKEELETIHEIEIQLDKIDEIKQQVLEAEQAAEEARKQRTKKWQDEMAEHAENRRREQDKHQYDMEQATAQAAAQFQALQEENMRKEKIRQEDVERDLAQRVEAVEEREAEIASKQAEIDGFPEKLEKAVADAKADVTERLTATFNQEKALLRKDKEAAEALATSEKTALQHDIEMLSKQIESLQTQLNSAREDAKSIAAAAVEASSQRQALATVQETIKTQAQSSGGGRRG